MRTRVSNLAPYAALRLQKSPGLRWFEPQGRGPEFAAAQSENLNVVQAQGLALCSQLHPWLVPHSVQTPQAPARMTLSLPQTEQVMPMKMLPSATVTRSGFLSPFPFASADVPPFARLDG